MFGRARRPSISSLELLEMQRPPPKIIKNDPFSIYETTLLKLKEGSHRSLSSPQTESRTEDIHITASHSPETSDLDCNAAYSPLNYSNAIEDNHFSKEPKRGTLSVNYLFSKYTNSRRPAAAEDEKAMDIEDNSSCS